MTEYELIDRLCAIVESLADLAREQAAAIAQADIPDGVRESMRRKRAAIEDEMDVLEYHLRRIR